MSLEKKKKVLLGNAQAECMDCSRRGNDTHGIFLLRREGTSYVVKCYGHKRSRWQSWGKSFGNYLGGRSSENYLMRYRTEKRVLALWRQCGFEVFRETRLPDLSIPYPHLVMEHVAGRTLLHYFSDPQQPIAEKVAVFRRFLPEWGRRHLLALQTGDRLLIQEHPSFKHVFYGDDGRLIFFDFETVYIRYDIRNLIAREIAGYARSLVKVANAADLRDFFDILVKEYPYREFLSYPYQYFFKSVNPVARVVQFWDRLLPRRRKSHSKYRVALLLREYLEGV